MPHYADGTLATPGDTVRGKGYNVKDEHGELAEITGTLLYVNADTNVCNVQVAVVEVHDVPAGSDPIAFAQVNPGVQILPEGRYAALRLEYGQADHFVKV